MNAVPVSDVLITLLAEPANTGPDFGKASPVGLLVVLLLLIGVFMLVWSMNRHIKRVPASFDAVAEAPGAGTARARARPSPALARAPGGRVPGPRSFSGAAVDRWTRP